MVNLPKYLILNYDEGIIEINKDISVRIPDQYHVLCDQAVFFQTRQFSSSLSPFNLQTALNFPGETVWRSSEKSTVFVVIRLHEVWDEDVGEDGMVRTFL